MEAWFPGSHGNIIFAHLQDPDETRWEPEKFLDKNRSNCTIYTNIVLSIHARAGLHEAVLQVHKTKAVW